jgi:hypothetical protein
MVYYKNKNEINIIKSNIEKEKFGGCREQGFHA